MPLRAWSRTSTAITPTPPRSEMHSHPTPPFTSPSGPAGRTPRTSPSPRRTPSSSGRASARRQVEIWEGAEAGPFTITALPAVDGLGDPQVSWLVEADGQRILHLGDTIFHGYWWRMARRHGPFDLVLAPINGASVNFPHLQPPSPLAATLEPEQAALTGELLAARAADPDPLRRLRDRPLVPAGRRSRAAGSRPRLRSAPYEARMLEPGESFEPAAAAVDA